MKAGNLKSAWGQKRVIEPQQGAAAEQTRDEALQRADDPLQRIAPGQSGRLVGSRLFLAASLQLRQSRIFSISFA